MTDKGLNIFEQIIYYIRDFITSTSSPLSFILLVVVLAVIFLLSFWLGKLLLLIAEKLVLRSSTTWDDDIFKDPFFSRVSLLFPAFASRYFLNKFYGGIPALGDGAIKLYIGAVVCWILAVLINNVYYAMAKRPRTAPYAIKGVFQMVKLVLFLVVTLFFVTILSGRSPMALLAGLSGMAAVLLLVFKDTLLGLVASVQITVNNLLEKGDWIVMDSHNVNGEVQDMSLTTIKVKNWDNSYSHIPPYAMVSESFRNYQRMRDAGGRRVFRSILIDLNSVKFMSPQQIQDLVERGFIPQDVAKDKTTNLGLFRAYLEHKINTDKRVVQEMLHMVRQLDPTAAGLPLQIYFFTSATAWKEFEQVQSDFFDEVFASIHLFELTMFQSPAGTDIKDFVKK